ncbi:MAG: lamin tail domain-containing protein [bacterium]
MHEKQTHIIWSAFLVSIALLSACLDPYSYNPDEDTTYSTTLVINEIVARDANGGNDWIELYVVGDEAVYLGDYALVDDNEDREPTFLEDIILQPGEFILIQATDDEPEDDSYYVPFTLGSDDSVTLYCGTDIIDVLDWEAGDAPSGYSYGRFPDGAGWTQMLLPTPNAMNEMPPTLSLVINEIMAKADDDGNDWIELFVAGDEPIFLGDYALRDDNEDHELTPLPKITLQPGGFAVIQATDEAPADGSYFVPFTLGSDDCVTLYYGTDIIDILDWETGDAPSGFSLGHLPDGTGEIRTILPTPGKPNELNLL